MRPPSASSSASRSTPPPDAVTRAAFHVDLVGALFIIWGVLTVLIGLSTLALGVGAAAIIASSSGADGGRFAAGLTAAAFTTLGLIAVAWGLAHAAIGVPVRRHRHWARLAALTLGSVDLLLLPYGTALGVYALWALLNEDGRRLFAEPDAPPAPGR